ncbi:MAG: hypothetical protein KDD69_14315 [Bdellovibrionales bacterium]|nr:hypothetical protein [Bdellovibrionales bacterium]
MTSASHIRKFPSSPLAQWDVPPWELTYRSEEIVAALLQALDLSEFDVNEGIAVHRSCTVESGAVLKAPLILGPRCFVAAGAYLRGGCWVEADCIFGPGAELKSSYVFANSKLAHFNFVGDSILGERVNLEAGSIICNYRNEREDKEIRLPFDDRLVPTGVDKFGALLGDDARLGANAVIAPGAIIPCGTVIRRCELFDAEQQVGK